MKRKKVDPRANPANLLDMMKRKPKYTEQQIAGLKAHALKLWQADYSHSQQLGSALLAVRQACGHGDFKKWWKANGLNQNRVSYCLRLAQGKVAEAKRKLARSPERTAVSDVKHHMAGFLEWCANPNKLKTVNELHGALGNMIRVTILGVSRVRHWQLVAAGDNKAGKARENLMAALWDFLDTAFVPVTFEDLERMGQKDSAPASQYKAPAAKPAPAGLKKETVRVNLGKLATRPRTHA